jgi:para-nitrobenzyl esterase
MIRIAETEYGLVKGLPAADPRITAFKGIPFAAPPVGENRWREPQPCSPWEGIRPAYEFGSISVQDTPGLGDDIYCREWHVDPDIPMSEDCLYLNIWTGAKSKEEKLPVLVWFFGGAFQWGYTAEMEFDGERLARRGIIVVSVNYRLNVFGFLAHPELTAEQRDTPTNFAHLDQQAGLLWVKRNIYNFGGDPENITIAGQSAGGMSVLVQITNPLNQGLFQKGIIQSGLIRSPYPSGFFGVPPKLQDAEALGTEFFAFLGVQSLSQARKLDPFYLLQKYNEFVQSHPRMMTVQDDKFCFGDPPYLYLKGHHVQVPLMAGNTSDEFLVGIQAETADEYKNKAAQCFGEEVDTFLRFKEAWHYREGIGYGAVNAIEFTTKALILASSEMGNPNCAYYYQFMPEIPGWDKPGAFHSVDLWFSFETLAKCWRPFTGKHYDLARKMANYWANFIKSGDPNGLDHDGSPLPEWKPYTKDTPCQMLFTTEGPEPVIEQTSEFKRFLIEHITEDILQHTETNHAKETSL